MTSPAPFSPSPSSDAERDIVVHVFGRTDVGRTREHNEDAFVVADLTRDNASLQPEVRTHRLGERGTLFMVADGLGGAAAGEIASELAVTTVYEELRDKWTPAEQGGAPAFAAALKAAVEAANARIFTYALEHPEHRGLGTTATVAGLLGDTLYLLQVGDSRAYLVRDGTAIQITKDQSLMQRLVEAGELTPEEAERSERRNIILQALGPEPLVKIDLTSQPLRRGDVLVLCTDGLSGLVKKDEIAEVVSAGSDLLAVCRELIDRANEYGGPDNITVIAARFDGGGLLPAEHGGEVGHVPFRLPDEEATPTLPHSRYFGAPPPAAATPTPPGTSAAVPLPRGGEHTARTVFVALAVTILLGALFLAAHQWRQAPAPGPAIRDTTPHAAAPRTP